MSAGTDDWTFEWRRSWDEVRDPEFVGRWQRVLNASASAQVYHCPEIVAAWADTVGAAAGAEPCFGVATSAAGHSIILPWVVGTHQGRLWWRKMIEPVGQDMFGYHDPLTDAAPASIDWRAFWQLARESVPGHWDQALFRYVHAELSDPAWSQAADGGPVLSLDGVASFDALLASCSSNHRGEIRRRRRRLEDRGSVELRVAGPADGACAVEEWRARIEPAYRGVWDKRPRRNTLLRPGLDAFLTRVLSQGLSEGWGHLSTLQVGGEPIAWHVGFIDRQRLYWWIPAHRQEWEPFAPGKVLLASLVEHGMAAGWREIHLLAGLHAYKLAWHPRMSDLREVKWHAPSVRGQLLSLYDAMRHSA